MPVRPVGIRLVALVFLLEAAIALAVAAFLLLNPGVDQTYDFLFRRLNWSPAFSSLLAAPPLLTAGLAGWLFRGLWGGREWARLAAMVVVFMLILTTVAGLAFVWVFMAGHRLALGLGLAALLLLAGLLVYLAQARLSISPLAQPDAAAPFSYPPFEPVAPPTAGLPTRPVPPPPRPPMAPLGAEAPTVVAAAPTQRVQPPATAARAASRAPAAWLVVRNGVQVGQRFELYADETLTLGRDPAQADVVLQDPTVSARHARIRYENERFVIYDLGSTNGTFLGEYRLDRQPLVEGDELRLGNTWLLFTYRPT
ncbi:MAG: FHA domain-containing protein [Anaerolineae bacterium]|nr:FHA domain-containing protein [Caldilineales bacterium]MCX7852181.1 FHA domain-containing protein [Caldilineales bacterium]MDW8267536.1 FHA domain-containing protein [Anaerolineae bacterium]